MLQDQSTDTLLAVLTGGMYHVAVSILWHRYDTIEIVEMMAPVKPVLVRILIVAQEYNYPPGTCRCTFKTWSMGANWNPT